MLRDLLREFRYAVRRIAKDKAQTATIVATLALAIGANTAIYSAVHGILIRPLPYPDPERLVRILSFVGAREDPSSSSVPDFRDWKEGATTFDAMAGLRRLTMVGEGQPPADVSALPTTLEYLNLVGALATSGRLIAPDDIQPGAQPVAVLTHAYWMRQYGGDTGVVGQSIRLGRRRVEFDDGVFRTEVDFSVYTVIGVAAPLGGPLTADVDVFVPWIMETDPLRENRNTFTLPMVVGRLRPGVAIEDAQAELNRIQAETIREQPGARVAAPRLEPLHAEIVADARPALVVLQVATALVLLIAISNIANVLLLRGSSRQYQLAVQAALGANRWRLAVGHLTESITLSLLAALGGVVVAFVCLRTLIVIAPQGIPRLDEIVLDGAVLSVTFAVAIVSGLLSGLVPVVSLRRTLMWRGGGVGVEGGLGGRRLRAGLLMVQLALSFVLLVGTSLMLRSFNTLRGVPIGVNPDQVVTFSLGTGIGGFLLGPSGRAQIRALQDYRVAAEHVSTLPGVRAVTLSSQAPLTRSIGMASLEILTGSRQGETHMGVGMVAVAENFFEFIGSQPIAGRLFQEFDAARRDDVVVVDSDLARLIWPQESAVGQRIRLFGHDSEVVGVVEPIRYAELAEELRPKLYHPLGRDGGMFGSAVLVSHDGDADAIMSRIEARVTTLGGDVRLLDLQPLGALYDEYLREPRFYMMLSTALGFLALIVAAVGVYGVTASSVAERTNEIALRTALGGARFQIVRSFYRRHVALFALGLGLGLLGAAWLTRYLRGLLFEIQPADPTAWIATAIVLGLVTFIAASIPLARALRVDPAAYLHRE